MISRGDYVRVPYGDTEMWLEVAERIDDESGTGLIRCQPVPLGLQHGEECAFVFADVLETVPAAEVPDLIARDFFRIPGRPADPAFDAAFDALGEQEAVKREAPPPGGWGNGGADEERDPRTASTDNKRGGSRETEEKKNGFHTISRRKFGERSAGQ